MELIVETSVFDDERLSDDVQEVQQVASTAMDIAGNNSQYFWCTEVGTDTGVHITLTPQDTFKANPSGYNLLARNNGVEVRDGLTACSVFTNGGTYFNAMLNGTNQLVAKYEASGAQIGAELSGYRNITIDNTNGIRFRNGTVNLAHYNIGSVVFYDGDTTTNHELMNLGTTGMTLQNSSGYKTFYVGNDGLIIYDGVNNSHDLLNLNTSGLTLKGVFNNTLSECAVYGNDGVTLYGNLTSGQNVVRSEIAKIFSGSGNTSSGTSAVAPYYTFGTRSSGTASTIGNYSFAEGVSVKASGYTSHAEGYHTTASGSYSHAEGSYATASGLYSHAEGNDTTASSTSCHAEGYGTTASAPESHAEGFNCKATNHYSHAEGDNTTASGRASHAAGFQTVAGYAYQTVVGKYNNNKSTSLFEVGKGTSDSARSNAFAVTETGVLEIGAPATTFIVRGTSSTQSFTGTKTFSLTAPTVSGYAPICFLNWNITGSTSSYCYGIGSQDNINTVTIKIRNTDSSTSITCYGYWLYCKIA